MGIAKDYLIVAECKYSNKKVGTDILQGLKEKSKNIKTTLKIKYYVLFSKSGFTNALKNLSDDSVILVELV